MIPAILLWLAQAAWSQQGPQVFSPPGVNGGLNTYQASLLIGDNEAQAANNVIFDKNGGISRRLGYSKRNATAIGGGDSDSNSVYQLETSGGSRYCVAYSSTNGYLSTDNCGTFSSFVSTLTRNNDVNCDALQNRLYCVNNQYDFYFDGTDDITFSGPANADFIRVHKSRCFAAGTDASPSRLYWSNLSDCTTWTTSTDYVDVSPNDGDVITGIGPPIFDLLPIYKKFSTWVLKGNDNNTFQLVNVSPYVGALNHRAIANFNNAQYFASVGPNGGKPGVYDFNGIIVQEASTKLRNDIDTLDTFMSRAGRRSVDSRADWDAGSFLSRAMSSSRASGFMQSSYTTLTDTLGADFGAGTLTNVSTQEVTGSLTLSSDTFTDYFTDGNYSENPAWTVITGGYQVAVGPNGTNELESTQTTSDIGAPSTVSSGTFQWDSNFQGVSKAIRVKFISAAADYGTSNGYALALTVDSLGSQIGGDLLRLPASVSVCNIAGFTPSPGASAMHTWRVVRSTTGAFEVLMDNVSRCTGTDNNYNTSANIVIQASVGTGVDNISLAGYKNTGNIVSRTFDMAISTPVWGRFQATVSSGSSGTGISFETQASTNGVDTWSTLTAQSLGSIIAASNYRYVRYKASYTTPYSTRTPSIADVTVEGASTGTWTSNELQLTGSSITAWGLFQTDQTTDGNATIAYEIHTATYAGGAAFGARVALTAGSAITASTGAYIVIIGTWTITSATETCRTDAVIVNWTEGARARSPTMSVFDGRLHFGAQQKNGIENDVIYTLDANGAWSKWTNVRPRFLNVVHYNFLMASSSQSSSGYIYKLYDGTSDDGGAFLASWKSKDFPLGSVQTVKAVDRLYVIHSNDPTTLTVRLNADTGLYSNSYSVSLSTGMAFGLRNLNATPPLNGNTFNVQFSNNVASQPWDVYGFGMQFRNLGLMQP